MAKVISEYKPTGRFDDVQLYRMDGEVYARMVSTLDGKKVKTHPRFARTRIEYKRLAKASVIAKRVYRQLPQELKIKGYFQKMTGIVSGLLKQGYTPQQAYEILCQAANSQQCLDTRTLPEQAYHIATAIYRQLPKHQQPIGYFEAIMDQAIQLLQENYNIEQVHDILHQATMPEQETKQKPGRSKAKNTGKQANAFVEELLNKIFPTPLHNQPIIQRCIINEAPP
ncbi:hypothetical protein F5148DRAFT_1294621 [Russula earlei]|uniref:Uncharacterized protein n=1 Tax=Russula earlei TaxID=71964 RepID=A0ACC0TRG9_9AGAM|nr:hypothetical protein F5148DRAFT_1294621 [Russula earlei]